MQGTVVQVPGLTQSKTCNDETCDQAVYGKVRENLPREPELGYTRIVKRRVSGGQTWLDVLVQRAHDNDGQRGVKEVVAAHIPAVKHTLTQRYQSTQTEGRCWELEGERLANTRKVNQVNCQGYFFLQMQKRKSERSS